uniref:UPAR/Ly6 domain-containing protein n=1 Tax=Panagrellus redivivus TaxID=6233 RepID=A0A7E4ZW91_PANRE
MRFLLTIFIISCSFTVINAIKCINCRTYDKELICDTECEGDFCVLWNYREMSTDHKIQGCITGIDTTAVPMGCRANKNEATMCLCNSTDLCNEESIQFSKTDPVPMVPIAETKCHSYTEAPYIPKVNKDNYCPSDYCFFTQTNSTNFAGEVELMTSTSCGQMPQYNFDFLIGSLWPGPGLFTNACYLLQAQGKDTMLGCSCSTDKCNGKNPYPVKPGNIHCHLAYGATSEDQLNAKEYCRGDFCVLQKTVVPGYGTQWLKGCLSANETDAVSKLKEGYRNILGIEQWFCKKDFCNFDVQSVAEFAPHLDSLNFFSDTRQRGGNAIVPIEDSAHEDNFFAPMSRESGSNAVKVDPSMRPITVVANRHTSNATQSSSLATVLISLALLIFWQL